MDNYESFSLAQLKRLTVSAPGGSHLRKGKPRLLEVFRGLSAEDRAASFAENNIASNYRGGGGG
jgi:hypothetical protein